MKWRDVIIGALVTLAVTIIAGVIVYYVTKEPAHLPLKEKLVFQSDTSAKFTSKKTKLSFHQIRVGNIGDEAAHRVLIGIEYGRGTKIIDSSVAFSSGPAAGDFSLTKKGSGNLAIAIGTVAPGELITIAMIVDAEITEQPSVAVKSDKSVGINAPIAREPASTTDGKSTIAMVLMPFAILVQFLLLMRLRNIFGGLRSINNIAFMYIHKGMCAEAKPLLQEDISKRGATSYELANYGLCLGIEGEHTKAEKNFQAAEFYAQGRAIKGLVEFNRGIVAYYRGDGEAARTHFRTALETSRRRIKRYAKYSDILAEIFKKDPETKAIFDK